MSNKDIHPIYIIPRSGKRRILSDQAQKDQGLTANRVKQNESMMKTVVNRLEYLCGQSPQKKDLLDLARKLCPTCGIALDRLAKRSRDCLVCWYCEHWPVIEPVFLKWCGEQPRGAYDSRNSCHCSPISTPPPAPEVSASTCDLDLDYDYDYAIDLFWDSSLQASHVPDVDGIESLF